MRKVAFALAFLAVASVAAADQPAEKEHVQLRFPFVTPFVNPCTGETVAIIGDCHFNSHGTVSADGTQTTMVRQNCTGRGLGSFRNKYQFTSIDKTDIVTMANEDLCGLDYDFESRGHIVANSKSEKFFFDFGFRFRIDENCNIVVDEQTTGADCRGEGQQ